jgi:hypothetical protein
MLKVFVILRHSVPQTFRPLSIWKVRLSIFLGSMLVPKVSSTQLFEMSDGGFLDTYPSSLFCFCETTDPEKSMETSGSSVSSFTTIVFS